VQYCGSGSSQIRNFLARSDSDSEKETSFRSGSGSETEYDLLDIKILIIFENFSFKMARMVFYCCSALGWRIFFRSSSSLAARRREIRKREKQAKGERSREIQSVASTWYRRGETSIVLWSSWMALFFLSCSSMKYALQFFFNNFWLLFLPSG
jgi:hypothetical protein